MLMRSFAPLRMTVLWFVLLSAPLAQAHDPFDIWSLATLRPDALQLEVTMAKVTALRLIDPEGKLRALSFENFSEAMRRLERAGPTLHVLTSGRKTLVATKVAVELTEENDVVFKITFPRPPPGKLHVHAAFLKKLGEDYGGILDISDADGADLAWDQLTFERTELDVVIPATKAPKP